MKLLLHRLAADESGQLYPEYLIVTPMVVFVFVGMSRVRRGRAPKARPLLT